MCTISVALSCVVMHGEGVETITETERAQRGNTSRLLNEPVGGAWEARRPEG
jgi:hypothetical protein